MGNEKETATEGKQSPEKSQFLLAPPSRKRPPKSIEEFKAEAKHILEETVEEEKLELREKEQYDAKFKVLKAEHKYLNTPPAEKRTIINQSYDESIKTLFVEERANHETQLALIQKQQKEKEEKEEKVAEKKRR